jgi:large subunit ribosomal protein L32
MPVPKERASKARKRKRRAHHALKAPGLSICPNCKQIKLPHRICGRCGYYGNRPIVEIEEEEE